MSDTSDNRTRVRRCTRMVRAARDHASWDPVCHSRSMGLVRDGWLALSCACNSVTVPSDTLREVPAIPDAGATTSQLVSTFALQKLLLGDSVTFDQAPDTAAWKTFGFNLDDLVTSSSSTNVCTLLQGASPLNQVDGNDGIDNAWGSVILPIIMGVTSQSSPSFDASRLIQSGAWTLQIQVTGLTNLVRLLSRTERFVTEPPLELGLPTKTASIAYSLVPFMITWSLALARV